MTIGRPMAPRPMKPTSCIVISAPGSPFSQIPSSSGCHQPSQAEDVMCPVGNLSSGSLVLVESALLTEWALGPPSMFSVRLLMSAFERSCEGKRRVADSTWRNQLWRRVGWEIAAGDVPLVGVRILPGGHNRSFSRIWFWGQFRPSRSRRFPPKGWHRPRYRVGWQRPLSGPPPSHQSDHAIPGEDVSPSYPAYFLRSRVCPRGCL